MMPPKKQQIHFDECLPQLMRVISKHLGARLLASGVILRDASGRLSFFSRSAISTIKKVNLEKAILKELGAYAYQGRLVAQPKEIGTKEILADPHAIPISGPDNLTSWLIDRRIVGSDWVEDPTDFEARPPRVVFGSLKGGVGRSTALVIAAADMAQRGRNVLAVDLDLEAPGVGHLLLSKERLPEYGAIDYLAENGIVGISDKDLDAFIGISDLTKGRGLVEVLPASGLSSFEYPENFMPKLSRAMIEDVSVEGEPSSVRKQIGEMITRFSQRKNYDVVLIDSRAGMAELAAGPILGLGATILLFGTAQQQTIDGYRYLFAWLSNLANRRPEARWRERIKMVQAKAPLDEEVVQAFSDDLWELFTEYLYDSANNGMDLNLFNFDPDDPEAPHRPLVIPFNQGFVKWDPVANPKDLLSSFYEASFRPFLQSLDDLISSTS